MLSKQIENAQKKVEEQNFLIRKRVLEYDDVMNQQREIIYEYRDRILEGEDMSRDRARADRRRDRADDGRVPGRRLRRGVGPRRAVHAARADVPGRRSRSRTSTANALEREELIDELQEDVVEAYDEREEELGDELMRALERYMLLQIIDERWREHLHDMDYLREGIHLRGFAQIEPLVAYKNEGFEMFTELMNNIWEEFARYIFNVEVEVEGQNGGGGGSSGPSAAARAPASAGLNYAGGHCGRPAERAAAAAAVPAGRCRPVSPRRPSTRRTPRPSRRRRSRRAASRTRRRSAATTRAGAARARSSRSAMAHSALRDQLKLLADYL